MNPKHVNTLDVEQVTKISDTYSSCGYSIISLRLIQLSSLLAVYIKIFVYRVEVMSM